MFEENTRVLQDRVASGAAWHMYDQEPVPDFNDSEAFNAFGIRSFNWEMDRYETVDLWEKGAPGYDAGKAGAEDQRQPRLAVFAPVGKPNGRMMLVTPGGGFRNENYICEGFTIIEQLVTEGYCAAILSYRLFPYTERDAAADMQRAIRVLRFHAEEWGYEKNKIAVSGGSAGGILTMMASVHFDGGNPCAADPVERESSRPDAGVVFYGAFTEIAFRAPRSEKGLWAPTSLSDAEIEEKLWFSPDRWIRRDMPPVFFWQCMDEDDPRFLLAVEKAMADQGVRFESHVFPKGPHGMGLCDGRNFLNYNDPHVARWFRLMLEWLDYYL